MTSIRRRVGNWISGTKESQPPSAGEWGKEEFYEELNSIQILVNEAHMAAELELDEDNKGYFKLGGQDNDGVMSESMRRQIVEDARVFAYREGLVKQAKTLYTTFGIGTGLIFQARDPKAQEVLEAFWNDKNNRKFTSLKGQEAMSNSLLVDGELPLVLFKSPGLGGVTLRKLDPLEIKEVATDVEDKYQERFYVRTVARRGKGTDNKTVVYRDWRNDHPKRPGETSNGTTIRRETPGTAPLFFVKLQEGHIRGYSLFTAMLHWADQHRQFMRARAAVTRAIAGLAFKLKVKGGQATVNALKVGLQSGRVAGVAETNPVETPGSTWIENAAADLSRMQQETGAQAAQIDGAMLVMMAGASVSIFPHYFGAGESFRLATASSMETPMRKVFESYSRGLVDMWLEIFNYILEQAGIPEENRQIEAEYPEIILKDMFSAMQALGLLLDQFPDMVESKAIQKKALTIMGLRKAEDILEEIPTIKRERPEDFGLPAFGGAKQKEDNDDDDNTKNPVTSTEAAVLLHTLLKEALSEKQ